MNRLELNARNAHSKGGAVMATETKDQKIVVRTKHGPGTFSLAIALFQPGLQHQVEFECQPFKFGESEIISLRAHIFGAENRSPQPTKTEKKFWRFTGAITKALIAKNRAWYSIYELYFWERPNQRKFFPPYFTWIYEINSRKGQIILTDEESSE